MNQAESFDGRISNSRWNLYKWIIRRVIGSTEKIDENRKVKRKIYGVSMRK